MLVCDDATCQAALPPVLLVSTRMLSEGRWRAVRDALPAHVHCWCFERGWVTGKFMAKALRLLAAALAPWRDSHEISFMADTYRAHITDIVWRTVRTLGFAYLLIPAKLTSALLPCDTHVFAAHKRALQLVFQARQAVAGDVADHVARVMSVVVQTYDPAVRAPAKPIPTSRIIGFVIWAFRFARQVVCCMRLLVHRAGCASFDGHMTCEEEGTWPWNGQRNHVQSEQTKHGPTRREPRGQRRNFRIADMCARRPRSRGLPALVASRRLLMSYAQVVVSSSKSSPF